MDSLYNAAYQDYRRQMALVSHGAKVINNDMADLSKKKKVGVTFVIIGCGFRSSNLPL